MTLTITDVQRLPMTSKAGKPFTSIRIKTKEYGEKQLSGFGDKINSYWKVGDVVEAEVEQKGEYYNFKASPITSYEKKEVFKGNINLDPVIEYNDKKTDSMKEMGAIRIAGDYANTLLELGVITPEKWQITFKNKADEVYNSHCVPF